MYTNLNYLYFIYINVIGVFRRVGGRRGVVIEKEYTIYYNKSLILNFHFTIILLTYGENKIICT